MGSPDDVAELERTIRDLRQELRDEVKAADLHSDLNRRIAEALENPSSGPGSSWHDLPEKVRDLFVRCRELEAERDAAWRYIENAYDIEPRTQLEAEAKENGFKYGLAMAAHQIWKRDPQVAKLRDMLKDVLETITSVQGPQPYELRKLSERITTLLTSP